MDQFLGGVRESYAQILRHDFFHALDGGELPLESYVGFLKAMSVLYADVAQVARAHPGLLPLGDMLAEQLVLLDSDLASFQRRPLPMVSAAIVRAHALGSALRTSAASNPDAALGALAALLLPPWRGRVGQHALAALGLGDEGTALLRSGIPGTTMQLAAALAEARSHDHVLAAAAALTAGLRAILSALVPFDATPHQDHVRALNPAAGTHAIPSDPHELAASLRAGEQIWRRFPYLAWRYGERGSQFTRSDSAWLATLASYAQPVVEQQVCWLGRVLASRGMPRWLMEQHLVALADELCWMLPAHSERYGRLRCAARALSDQRAEVMDDVALGVFAASFDAMAGASWAARLPEAGALLAAAVADVHLGLAQALPSIEGWMTSSDRFPERWIGAVRQTIRAAQAHVQQHAPS